MPDDQQSQIPSEAAHEKTEVQNQEVSQTEETPKTCRAALPGWE